MDQVEALEVGLAHLTRAVRMHLDAAAPGLGHRARVGRVAALLVGDGGAVDIDIEAGRAGLVHEEYVGRGGAADVAGAHKQN